MSTDHHDAGYVSMGDIEAQAEEHGGYDSVEACMRTFGVTEEDAKRRLAQRAAGVTIGRRRWQPPS